MKLNVSPIVAKKKLGKHVLAAEERGDWNVLLNGLLTKLRSTLNQQGLSLDVVQKKLEANHHDQTFDATLDEVRQALLSLLMTSVNESNLMGYRVEKEEGTLGMGLTGVNTVTQSNAGDHKLQIGLTTFYLPGRKSHVAAGPLATTWPVVEPETLEHMIFSQCFLRSVRNIHKMGPSRFFTRADCCDLSRRIPLTSECRVEAWMESRRNCKRLEKQE